MRLSSALLTTAAAMTLAFGSLGSTSASATGHGRSAAMAPMKSGHVRSTSMHRVGHRPKKTSLYTRLGGKAAIRAVVEDFVNNVAADERINRFFAKTNLPRLRRLLAEQICAGAGGPCKYTGRSMKASHRGLGISSAHFGALVEDLQKSLRKFGVPAREQAELLALLGPMQKDIVERR